MPWAFRPWRAPADQIGTLPESWEIDAGVLRKFATSVSGPVIVPGDAEYDIARQVFNRAFDRHPALIVRCLRPEDMVRTLDFARRYALPLSVRGGGHNRAGLSVCDRGVVIDTSQLNRVRVDARARRAEVDAGAQTVHVDAAAQPFGLATTLAGCPAVGVAGLTLGGGEGLLMSKFGASCDNLISANLILADGRQVVTSANMEPELFWAIRGGGGNFGIATRLEYHLHPVGAVMAGTLRYEPGRVRDCLDMFARFVRLAPDEMNVVGQILPSPERARFAVLICYCGNPARGDRILEPLRKMQPAEERLRVAPYSEVNATINPATRVGHFQTNLVLPSLNEEAIRILSESTAEAPSETRVFMVPLYGAVARVPLSATAFPLRGPCIELDIMGRWKDAAEAEIAEEWVKRLRDRLKPLAVGAYSNQLGETSPSLAQLAYGQHYSRLANVKRRFDPDNVFRSNQNILPG